MREYEHIFKRLEKLSRNIEHVTKENIQLRETNRKLRNNEQTYISRLAASERVLASYIKDDEEEQLPT